MEFMKIEYYNIQWRAAKKMLEEELNFFKLYPERWIKKHSTGCKNGHHAYCVTGFLMYGVKHDAHERGAAFQALAKNVPENFAPWPSVGATQNYNDAVRTTYEDIIILLEDAIRTCDVAIRETR